MTASIHTTTLRIGKPLWNAIRFMAYLSKKSCNQIITDILEETVPNHLDSLEYNTLDWQPNNPEIEKQLRPEFQRHQRNLQNLGANEE